jgi:hypothetical protein
VYVIDDFPLPLLSSPHSTQLVSVSYMSNMFPSDYTQTTKCYSPSGPTAPSIVRTMCGPQTFTAATGGGFVVIRNYTVRSHNAHDS